MKDKRADTLFGTLRSIARAAIVAATLAGTLAGPSTPAMADDSVITAFERKPSEDGLALSFKVQGNPDTKLIYMRNPDRIAIDFIDTVPAVDLPDIADGKLVTRFRHGLVSRDRYRLVLSLGQPATASLERAAEEGALVLDLRPAERQAFDRAVSLQQISDAPGETGEAERETAAIEPDESKPRFTVVVDAGHGGIDTGAKGRSGTLEKAINLQFSLALRDALEEHEGVEVIMTRESDEFIPLGERSAIAQRADADLFISMHADSIRYPTLRGASVYTLSEQASDALASEIADSENASDRFAGPEWRQEEPEVFDILVDLTRRETVAFSEHFAANLVEELGDHEIRLIKNPKRSAGFRVLKAPEVPSVLVEIGYLSNRQDEKLLKSEKWRNATAKVIGAAVMEFLLTHPSTANVAGG